MKPHALMISLTEKCNASCDFCRYRSMQKSKSLHHVYSPLVLGSLFENSLEDLYKSRWEKNEFLRELIKKSSLHLYFKYRKELNNSKIAKSLDPCYYCFLIRSNKSIMKNFYYKKNYDIQRKLKLKEWKNIICEAENLKLEDNVLFIGGGGEPTLEFRNLLELIRFSKEKFEVHLVTNGFFANSYRETFYKLKKLSKAGLKHISLSWDYHPSYKFHQSFISEKNLVLLYKIAKELGFKVTITSTVLDDANACELYDDFKKKFGNNFWMYTSRKLNIIEDLNCNLDYLLDSLICKIHYYSTSQDLFSVVPLRFNLQVQRKMGENYFKYNPYNDYILKIYLYIKSLGLKHVRKMCGQAPLILSNGLVFVCSV